MAKDNASDIASRWQDSSSTQMLDIFTYKVGNISRSFHNPTPRHFAGHSTYEDCINDGRSSFIDMNRPTHLGWTWERCRARQTSVKNSNGYGVIRLQRVVVIGKNKGGTW